MVGDSEPAFALAERALSLVDDVAEPLRYARLLGWYGSLREQAGQLSVENLDYLERAVELCAPYPGTPQHAVALAELGAAAAYSGDENLARSTADQRWARTIHMTGHMTGHDERPPFVASRRRSRRSATGT